MNSTAGKLVIISGPSGAGKSLIVRKLIEFCPKPLVLSVSATTRRPRPGEIAGKHYHFLSHEEFAAKREAGEFLECKEVFERGDWYGTLKSEVATGRNAGKWVILEIDVQGALALLAENVEAMTFFVHAGSIEELRRRLEARKTETPESLSRRLEVAERELKLAENYQYIIVNDTVERAVREMCDILTRQGPSKNA